FRDVIRIEDRDLCRLRKTIASHHIDVHHRDRQDTRTTPRCRRDRADALRSPDIHQWAARRERNEMLGDTDRTHSRSAAAMRNTKSLMQVEMADVGADITRARQPDHGVHVRPIAVHLGAILMDDAAYVAERRLE